MFDSGLGGLTVFREVAKARPDARYVYVADDAFFPYGGRGETELVARVVALMGELIEAHRPDLDRHRLQHRLDPGAAAPARALHVPFVGTVPAIKPACAASRHKRVSVLGTEATVRREYTRALIRDFANGSDVTLVGSRAARAASPRRSSAGDAASTTRRSPPRSRPASSMRAAGAPTRSCSPAPIIRCCSTASSGWRPGR